MEEVSNVVVASGGAFAGFLLGLFVSGGIVFYLKNFKKRLIWLKKDEVAEVTTTPGGGSGEDIKTDPDNNEQIEPNS